MGRRIVFLSQLFDPEYSIKGLEFIKYLTTSGHQVEVITTFPNYPKGQVYLGYKKKLRLVEYVHGVRITRLWSYISPSKSKLSRILNYASFFLVSTVYLLFRKKFDLLYGYHPQVTTGLTGAILRGCKGTPFITDIQDLWPESLIAEGSKPRSVAVNLIRRIVKPSLRYSAAIIVLSEGFKDYLIKKGVDSSKIHVVLNWCPEENRYSNSAPAEASSCNQSRPLRFFYTGNHGPLQGLSALIEAFSSIDPLLATLTLVGQGSERPHLKTLCERLQANNIEFLDFVPPEVLAKLLTSADVLVCSLRPDPLFDITIPSKIQAYLCAGKPILICAGNAATSLVTDASAGLTARPGDHESISEAILNFAQLSRNELRQMGGRGKAYYNEYLSSPVAYKKLLEIIENV